MAAISTMIGAIGVAGGLVGTGFQVAGQMAAQKEMKKQSAISQTQMNLESSRQKRQIIRQAMIARSEAVSNATNQGAAQGSGLQGGMGQITAEAGSGVSNVNLGQQLGNQMFASKARQASAETMTSIGSGIESLGGALVRNQDTIGRLGTYMTTPAA